MTDELSTDLDGLHDISDSPLVVALHVVNAGKRALQRGQALLAVGDTIDAWWTAKYHGVISRHLRRACDLQADVIQALLREAQELGS